MVVGCDGASLADGPAGGIDRAISLAVLAVAGTSVSGGYGIKGAAPASYVIDRAGVVRFAAAGAFDDRSFDALVTPLLREPAPGEATSPTAK